MKRAATSTSQSKAKRPKLDEPEYHETPCARDEHGEIVWPAPTADIENARRIITECAEAKKTTLIVPDKDADGLTSGAILYKTLRLLGLPESCIVPHFLTKGENVHSSAESARLAATDPSYIFVLDQGSRPSPPLTSSPHTALIIDHHFASPSDFPEGSHHVNASHYPPVATSSLLTYHICAPLHPSIREQSAWLCCIGTHGDLGSSLKWLPPFPDMSATLKQQTKKAISDAVAQLNAPRRTPGFDVASAWAVLLHADGAKDVARDETLAAARREVAAEVERCARAAPKFSRDGRVAVLRIESAAQIHPLVATRWAQHLASKTLEVVLCANSGYAPGLVNFSCRVARSARARRSLAGEDPVDIIAMLKTYASEASLLERMGDNFARGHVEASGGIVPVPEFEALMAGMGVGEKPGGGNGGSPVKAKGAAVQKNTLTNYFIKS